MGEVYLPATCAIGSCLADPGVPCGSGYCPGGYICRQDETCLSEPSCGNGIADKDFCDEGNATPGDGCDAACRLDLVRETEPNEDGRPEVNGPFEGNDFSTVNANGPYEADTIIAVTLGPAGDEDVFVVTNRGPAMARVRFNTHDAAERQGLPCHWIDTVLFIRDNQGNILTDNDDRDDGLCSTVELDIALDVTVYAHVLKHADDGAILEPGYRFTIDFRE